MATNKFNSNTQKNNCTNNFMLLAIVVFLFSAITAFMSVWVVYSLGGCEEDVAEIATTEETEPKIIKVIITEAEPIEEAEPVIEKEYLGEFRITAYCSCKKCCGKWAENRPNGIVYGASGEELKAGVSVASFYPFGTKLYIDGLGEYVVQDRPSEWVFDKYGKNVVDVYFDNHEEACAFGLKHLDVYEMVGNK